MERSFKTTFHRYVLTDGVNRDYDLVRIARKQKSLTFNEQYLNPSFTPHWAQTPFREIKITSPHDRINTKYLKILNHAPVFTRSFEQYCMSIRKALKQYFIRIHNKEKWMMFHSGGFDSRLISLVLMELRDEGLEFDIHFRCHQPEGEIFLKLMRMQGWRPSQYSVYQGPDLNYYHIGDPKKPLNGWQNYNQTMNFWIDIIPEEKQKEYNLIAGMGGEIHKFIALYYNKNKIKYTSRCKGKWMNLFLNQYPFEGEWEAYWMREFKDLYLPYFSYDYLDVIIGANPKWCTWDGLRDSVRVGVVSTFGKEFANVEYGKHDYSWNIMDKLYDRMLSDYHGSLFYNDYGNKVRDLNLPLMYKWDAKMWGFMTVYDAIYG